MEIPENPQKSRECKLKNLRVGISKKWIMKKFTLLITVFCLIVINAIAQPAQLEKGQNHARSHFDYGPGG